MLWSTIVACTQFRTHLYQEKATSNISVYHLRIKLKRFLDKQQSRYDTIGSRFLVPAQLEGTSLKDY